MAATGNAMYTQPKSVPLERNVTPKSFISDLHPGSFAMVMAIGIVASVASAHGLTAIANILFLIDIAMFAFLTIFSIVRIFRYSRAMRADLIDSEKGYAFLTCVAGTAILGNDSLLIGHSTAPGLALLALSACLWLVLNYLVTSAMILRANKPTQNSPVNSSWLLLVVATQSIVVLACGALPHIVELKAELFFAATALWFLGAAMYACLITLIFQKYTLSSGDIELKPTHWIDMGAMAITVLSGTALAAHAPDYAQFSQLVPLFTGVSVASWAVASWAIPMALIMALSQIRKVKDLKYDATLWSFVFPLGMYAACTNKLSALTHLSILQPLSVAMFWFSLVAWMCVFFLLLSRMAPCSRTKGKC